MNRQPKQITKYCTKTLYVQNKIIRRLQAYYDRNQCTHFQIISSVMWESNPQP